MRWHEPEQITATLTTQSEPDRVEVESTVVIAAVVALSRLLDVQENQRPIWCHFVPWQQWAVVEMPHHRYPSREHTENHYADEVSSLMLRLTFALRFEWYHSRKKLTCNTIIGVSSLLHKILWHFITWLVNSDTCVTLIHPNTFSFNFRNNFWVYKCMWEQLWW